MRIRFLRAAMIGFGLCAAPFALAQTEAAPPGAAAQVAAAPIDPPPGLKPPRAPPISSFPRALMKR